MFTHFSLNTFGVHIYVIQACPGSLIKRQCPKFLPESNLNGRVPYQALIKEQRDNYKHHQYYKEHQIVPEGSHLIGITFLFYNLCIIIITRLGVAVIIAAGRNSIHSFPRQLFKCLFLSQKKNPDFTDSKFKTQKTIGNLFFLCGFVLTVIFFIEGFIYKLWSRKKGRKGSQKEQQ